MKYFENAFNKDVCLFEVSRTISIPTSSKINLPTSKRLIFNRASLMRTSPIIASELFKHLNGEDTFYLDLLKNEIEIMNLNYAINGKASVFIFSGNDSNFKAGSIISLLDSETVSLPLKHFRNHFIGIAT